MKNFLKKLSNNLLYIICGIILAVAGTVYAANVSVPQATQVGDLVKGLSTGNYTLLHPGSTGQVLTVVGGIPAWAAATGSTASILPLIANGTVAGVNATSSTASFNVQGTGALNPFIVASSSGTQYITILANGNIGFNQNTPTVGFETGVGKSVKFDSFSTGIVHSDSVGLLSSSPVVLTSATQVSGVLPVANGGTGTTTPGLIAGTNITLSGSFPFQTINSSGGGSGVPSTTPFTNGHLPYATSTLALTDSPILTDGNVVGIGTTSPTVTFSLQGIGSLNPFVISSSTGTSLLSVDTNGDANIAGAYQIGGANKFFTNSGNTMVRGSSGNGIGFDVNGASTYASSTMAILSNGNITFNQASYPQDFFGPVDASPFANIELNDLNQGPYGSFGIKVNNGGGTFTGDLVLDTNDTIAGIPQYLALVNNTGAATCLQIKDGGVSCLSDYNGLSSLFDTISPAYNASGNESGMTTTLQQSAGNDAVDYGIQSYPGIAATGIDAYQNYYSSTYAQQLPQPDFSFWEQANGNTSESKTAWHFLVASTTPSGMYGTTTVIALGDVGRSTAEMNGGAFSGTGATIQIDSSSTRANALSVSESTNNVLTTDFIVTNAGNASSVNVTDSSLTSGNCVQAGAGGLLTTVGSPCGSGGTNYWTTTTNGIFNNSGYLVGVNSTTPTANLVVEGSSTAPTLNELTVASSSGVSNLQVTSIGNLVYATSTANSLAGFDANNILQSETLGTGLSITGKTLNASNAFTGSGSNNQITYWTSSTGLAGSSNFLWTNASNNLSVTGQESLASNSSTAITLSVQASGSQSANLINVLDSGGTQGWLAMGGKTGTTTLSAGSNLITPVDAVVNAFSISPTIGAATNATDTILSISPTIKSPISFSSSGPISVLYGQQTLPIVNFATATTTIQNFYNNWEGLTATKGTINNYYGNFISAPTVTANDTLTNVYGLVIAPSASTTVYNVFNGIGTTTPNSTLVIQGSSGQTANLFTVASSSGVSLLTVNPNGNLTVSPTNTSTPFTILTTSGATAEQFDLTKTNGLSIGTTSTASILMIQGNVANSTSSLLTIASSTGASYFYIDNSGHQWTGGASPTCGAGCSSVTGDDSTMRVVTGSGVTAVTVNFANKWVTPGGVSISPACSGSDESGGTTTSDPSTTPTTVTINLSASLTSKNLAVQCRGSLNFTQ